jgi:hypothetical protein
VAGSGGIDRGQRGAAFEARDCLQEAHLLVGAQHERQLARLTQCAPTPVLAERYALEDRSAQTTRFSAGHEIARGYF